MSDPKEFGQIGHQGREERWVPDLPEGVTDYEGRDYVRWVCSCGAQSQEFIDRDNECEADFHRHVEEAEDPHNERTRPMATDMTIKTANPKALEDTLQQLPGAAVAVVDGSWNGDTCVVRVFSDVGFMRYAITQQGYGEIVSEAEVE